jgi:hypothetical protein
VGAWRDAPTQHFQQQKARSSRPNGRIDLRTKGTNGSQEVELVQEVERSEAGCDEDTKTQASKQAKIEHRRPAVMPGDLAGAEYNPARTEEGDRVAQTGMNPRASRAGLLVDLPSLATAEGG